MSVLSRGKVLFIFAHKLIIIKKKISMEGNREEGIGGRRCCHCWNWLMNLQKAGPSCYLWDSSPGSQCPCSLSSFKKTWKIFQASYRALSTTIQSKVGIQVHNNNKNQQPCKTVADNIHNKHNASTHGITCVQDFLKYFLENCLTYIHSVPIYNPFTPLGCWMLYGCITVLFLSTIADIHLMHILKTKVPLSKVPRWNFSPGFNKYISQKIGYR